MLHYNHLIVGGGVAGTTAAETIRKLDPNATIAIISAERHPLYSRVLLPHYVKGRVPREKVFLRTGDHLEKLHIDFFAHRRVIGLRPERHEATLDDGKTIRYDKLLWAAGGEARKPTVPGADLPGVLYFRTIEDADAIVNEVSRLQTLPEQDRVAAIVGGGFIALEFPPFFAPHGIKTHLIVDTPRYWDRLLDSDSSGIIHDVLTEHGIEIHYNEEGSGFVGTRALKAVQTKSGKEIRASVAGVGVGLAHNVGLLTQASVQTDAGVLTNEYLETNIADLYAAGDVAEFFDVYAGRRRHLGNWMNAQEQGRIAGANMAGGHEVFRLVSQYATMIFELSIAFVGDVLHGSGVTLMTHGNQEIRKRAQFFIRDGRLVGATLMNMAGLRGKVAEMIKSGEPFDYGSFVSKT